ncbi:hypothetical protein ACOMHN_023803 [Nucella lapillus]
MSRGITLNGGGSSANRNRDINFRIRAAGDGAKSQDTCTAEYKAIPGHTMCLRDDARVTRIGVTSEERQQIIRLHNEARASVQPPATDLTTMIWNDELAARLWPKNGPNDLGLSVGQNVAGGYRSWESAIQGWHDEVKMYRFGQVPDSYLGKNGWVKIGHYTQMVQNTTHLVGCGYASCKNSKYGRYFVCNYAAANDDEVDDDDADDDDDDDGDDDDNEDDNDDDDNDDDDVDDDDHDGVDDDNAATAVDGGAVMMMMMTTMMTMCVWADCQGRICLNGGTLDKDSCTCQCPPIYKGDDCSQVNCPSEDPFYCGRDISAGDCGAYFNVPHMCPFMCGVCTGGKGSGINVNIGGKGDSAPPQAVFTSAFGCKYEGKRATPEECKGFGNKGDDKDFCASKGGEFGCDECSLYYNIKRDYCPVQCGLCDAPCGGKACENGGELDTDTCTCQCSPLFSGPTCQDTLCPKEDEFHCSFYAPDFCKEFVNVPKECPYKCGVCKK